MIRKSFGKLLQKYWWANATTRPAGMRVGDTTVYCTRKEIPDAFEATRKYQTYDRSKIYNAKRTVKDNLRYTTLSKFMDPTPHSTNAVGCSDQQD